MLRDSLITCQPAVVIGAVIGVKPLPVCLLGNYIVD
jgi:hypothetical protein